MVPNQLQFAPAGPVGWRRWGIWAGLAMVLLLVALAVCYLVLTTGQYRLGQLEAEIGTQREQLLELRIELQELVGPEEVARMGVGALGMTSPEAATEVVLAPHHIAANGWARGQPFEASGGDWQLIKPLMAQLAGRDG